MAECVDDVLSLIGGSGAIEISLVEFQVQIGGGDLVLGAYMEASQRHVSTVHPKMVIDIY